MKVNWSAATTLLLIILSNFFAFSFAQAQNEDDDANAVLESITYKNELSKLMPPDDDELVTKFEHGGFVDVTVAFAQPAEKLHFAHVFASPSLDKFVVLRYDFTLEDPSIVGRVIALQPNTYLVHTKNQAKRPVAVYFEGFGRVEINRILFAVQSSHPRSFVRRWLPTRLLVNEANAADLFSSAIGANLSPANRATAAFILKKIAECGNEAFQSIYDSVRPSWSMARMLLSGKVFSGFREMAYGVHFLITKVIQAYEYYKASQHGEFNPSELMGTACYIVGGLVADEALSVLTAGAGNLIMMTSVKRWVEKFEILLKRLDEIPGVKYVKGVEKKAENLEGEHSKIRVGFKWARRINKRSAKGAEVYERRTERAGAAH